LTAVAVAEADVPIAPVVLVVLLDEVVNDAWEGGKNPIV